MKIVMNYPGGVISVNSYKYYKTRGIKTETRQWMEDLVEKVTHHDDGASIAGKPVRVKLFGRFKNNANCPDLHNLHKVIGDALQVALLINDRYISFEDTGFDIGYKEPVIEIEINLAGEASGGQ
jgi:Holliday junction resolvase RusA-like endonuclease